MNLGRRARQLSSRQRNFLGHCEDTQEHLPLSLRAGVEGAQSTRGVRPAEGQTQGRMVITVSAKVSIFCSPVAVCEGI